MPLRDSSESALKVFYKAHSFIHDYGIHWLPINPEDIIDQNPNCHLAETEGRVKKEYIRTIILQNETKNNKKIIRKE